MYEASLRWMGSHRGQYVREREEIRLQNEGGDGGVKPGEVPGPRPRLIHFTYITETHAAAHKGTLWAMCECQLAHVLCSVVPSREA